MAEDENPAPEEPPAEAAGDDEDVGEDFKYIVRIANTDLDGHKQVRLALTGIKGVGPRVAGIIAQNVEVPMTEKIGNLSDEHVQRLADAVNGLDASLPVWMRNRRNDVRSGDDLHVLTTELDATRRDDLNRLKKIRSYRGVRHETGQKVRGQRTRANGRSGLAMGVSRKKEQ